MNSLTAQHTKIKKHVEYNNGRKTVCVSACLSFLNIDSNSYKYTSSKTNHRAYENVIRRNGYGLRSRATEFKLKRGVTNMTQLRMSIKKSNYNENDYFLVFGYQKKCAHLMILDGKGNIVIDTSPKSRWKIYLVHQIIKKS